MNGETGVFPHLSKAPITEAIIDFRVKLPDGFDIGKFATLRHKLERDYPHVEEKKLLQSGFQQEVGKQPVRIWNELGVHGDFFLSADRTRIAQFRQDGFTFNRLMPYTSWDDVFAEASRLWNIYVETAAPSEVSRIAVRYINRILLPLPLHEFSEFLNAPPVLPADVPPHVTEFLSRIVIQDLDKGIAANVVQALEPLPRVNYLPVILDIDVYRQNLSDEPNQALLLKFAELRNLKNRIFFGSLTPKAIQLFV
jgi:uncharacterized protein (TIGR04255 family)